jgi:asparagine synthase (glutamine-hydrolysing)
MCGIVGKVQLRHDDRVTGNEIAALLQPIAHRGPDGSGIHVDGPAGIGHVRLAIIDLSTGAQPMANEDESVWIVFNGEIYNYQELAAELVARGHVFRSRSDTETIIHLYEEYGDDCLTRLRGMFTFAIWDQRQRRLLVARDRVGIKPLYYCQAGSALLFASEMKALLADPSVGRGINDAALRHFYSFYYGHRAETPFRNIKKLLPGHKLIVERGSVLERQYWDLQFKSERHDATIREVEDSLYDLLKHTVADHMIADVPVGVLLSGGVDSSAVLSLAVQSTSRKVSSYTIGFDDPGTIDERPFAREVAMRFGSEHNELSITPEDFWGFLRDYVWYMEEPVCEPPAVALFYISRLARKHVKVLLSGEGGDEAFAGYPSYVWMMLAKLIGKSLGVTAPYIGSGLGLVGGAFGLQRLSRYSKVIGEDLHTHYYSRASDPTKPLNRLASEIFSQQFLDETGYASPQRYMREVLTPVKSCSLLDQMLYADTKTWLPDDLLIKADKMTMANSLELRVPLLDHRVLEFAATLAPVHKIQGREQKRALKGAFAKILPNEILNRKKAGFPVPYARWLSGPLAKRVREVVLSNEAIARGYLRRDGVERLLIANERTGKYAKEVFSLLIGELWFDVFCRPSLGGSERLVVAGRTASVLS